MYSKYWANKGKYSKEIGELYDTGIIPPTGYADSSVLEVIRLVSKIGYEIYNNGGFNMLDGQKIDDYYQEIFDELIMYSSRIGLGSLARKLVITIKNHLVPTIDENLADAVGEILDELLDKAYEYYVSHEK
ncbi:MAG: hypothetical protein QXE78_01980 [Nitrososphaeria archaeon]